MNDNNLFALVWLGLFALVAFVAALIFHYNVDKFVIVSNCHYTCSNSTSIVDRDGCGKRCGTLADMAKSVTKTDAD